MKNFKQLALGLLVGAIAIGFSAFTPAKHVNHKKDALKWFHLKSTVAPNQTNALISSNYDAPTSEEPCATGSTYCAVQADDVSGAPDLGTGTEARSEIQAYFGTSPSQGVQISAEDN